MWNIVSLLFLIAAVFAGQGIAKSLPDIEASLALEKQQYVLGEPIMLVFKARYHGRAGRVELSNSDPYGQCPDYRISVFPEASSREPQSGPSCEPLFRIHQFNCMFGSLNLIRGAEIEQRILLNRLHDFTQPGVYVVQASRHLSYFANLCKKNQPTGEAAATFTFAITAPHSPDEIQRSFSLYVTDLSSASYQRRQEAETVISSLPAPFLEADLLRMLATPYSRYLAIRGLQQLNTGRTRAALFELLKSGDSFSTDQELAIQALRSMGDASYGPQLLELMTGKNTQGRAKLLAAAARLDPTHTWPLIQPFLDAPDYETRKSGVTALAATEQSQALPILVRMLSDSSFQVRAAAAEGLIDLTRQSPSNDGRFWPGSDPASAAPYWSAWLQSNPELPVHLVRECPQAARW